MGCEIETKEKFVMSVGRKFKKRMSRIIGLESAR